MTLSVLTSQDTYCYVWDQTVAGRGSNEVASCLKKYLNDHVKGTAIEEVTFICDNCPSQNKNRMQNEMISVSVIEIPNLKAMSFVFLEKGHTHNENDTAHSCIEKAKSGVRIDHPYQWQTLIQAAYRKNPFDVTWMNQTDFYDFSNNIGWHLYHAVLTGRSKIYMEILLELGGLI